MRMTCAKNAWFRVPSMHTGLARSSGAAFNPTQCLKTPTFSCIQSHGMSQWLGLIRKLVPGKHKANGRVHRATPPHTHHAFDCHQFSTSQPQTHARRTGAVAQVHPHGFRCLHSAQRTTAACARLRRFRWSAGLVYPANQLLGYSAMWLHSYKATQLFSCAAICLKQYRTGSLVMADLSAIT